uniref:C-type lectin domain-containing protein n=1 Tax=Poecilia latipinna TaxID=48699 RepID=A0A3B3THU4_9TELE
PEILTLETLCPTDWTAINDRCFRYVADVKTWAAAEKHCLYLGANLASVHSQEDNHHLQALIFTATRKSNKAWIGDLDLTLTFTTVVSGW